IPNTTKVTYQNKSHVDGKPDSETPPTPPVTVTPPTPNTPPIEKKVNGADSANLEARQEVFTYTIDTAVPTGAHAFEITDTLEDVLTFEGDVTATLDDKAISADQIKIDGQTVTVKLTKEQVRKQAGKAVHVEFSAKVKDGANLTPYMTDGKTSIPNTASYIINNNPDTKKDSNTVPVVPPTPNEPGIDKKINRDLTHLDIEENKSYMYNVNVDLPQDIATYKEFIVTDNLVDALAINGDVVAYVDGYSTDAIKVDVAGNKVTATVTDFAKLAGFKEIQLYIPAIIADATKASEYVDNKVPNTARLDFVDSNGVKKNKETNPVTVTPPTPPTPPNTPKEPTPDAPRKTVSLVDGLEQAEYLRLPEASQAFRFDIKSVVPKDQAEDNRLDLSSITITDTLDPLFTVKKENVFVKITGNAPAEANFIDEDVAKAAADLKDAEDKLKELKASSNKETALTELEAAKKTVADLEAKLEADNKVLAELKAASTTETSDATAETETSSEEVTDNSAAIAEQEKVIANDKAQLETAKTALATAETAVAEAKTAAEIQVDISNQEKVVAEAKTVKEKAKKRQEKLQARLTSLAKLTAKGELTNEAIAELGGNISITDDGRTVMVDFSDEYTMEALKGYTVNVIIYSSITDVTALKGDHFTKGIDNTATVQFNHDPSVNLTKKTNKVTVVPPRKNPPKGQTPPPPKGELPRIPEPKPKPKHIPPANTPKAKKKLPSTLPKTGESSSHLGLIGLGIVSLGSLAFYMVSRKKRDF
ncbi:isopeptide-forming domain-containing fimbrial protein, partial [Streptococcus pluranimalium]